MNLPVWSRSIPQAPSYQILLYCTSILLLHASKHTTVDTMKTGYLFLSTRDQWNRWKIEVAFCIYALPFLWGVGRVIENTRGTTFAAFKHSLYVLQEELFQYNRNIGKRHRMFSLHCLLIFHFWEGSYGFNSRLIFTQHKVNEANHIDMQEIPSPL